MLLSAPSTRENIPYETVQWSNRSSLRGSLFLYILQIIDHRKNATSKSKCLWRSESVPPDRHVASAVTADRRISPINYLVHHLVRKNSVIVLSENCEVGRGTLEFFAEWSVAFCLRGRGIPHSWTDIPFCLHRHLGPMRAYSIRLSWRQASAI